jgi:hypothetical protein
LKELLEQQINQKKKQIDEKGKGQEKFYADLKPDEKDEKAEKCEDDSKHSHKKMTCLICEYKFEDSEDYKLRVLKCNHHFHDECITAWF